MRLLFLIGSLTVGAALAGGLSQFGFPVRLALGVAAIAGAFYIFCACKCANVVSEKVVFIVDRDSERYTEAEVSEFLHALSEAKARSAAPFPSQRMGHFTEQDS